MAPALPTIGEIATSLRTAMQHPNALREDEIRRLTNVLHASYDERCKDDYDALAHKYAKTTDDGNDLQQDTVLAFANLSNGSADWIVCDLIRYFDTDAQFYELAHAMLALAFPASSTADDLFIRGNMQRDVLSAMINNEPIWRSDMTIADRLAKRGLPTDRDGLTNLMASTENVG